jgi:hypothetical protein
LFFFSINVKIEIREFNSHPKGRTMDSQRSVRENIWIQGEEVRDGWNVLAEIGVFFTGALMFYGTGLACCALFMKLGTKWPELALLWQRTEQHQIRYGYPTNLRLKIRTLTVIILTLALGRYTSLFSQYVPLTLNTSISRQNVRLILHEKLRGRVGK